MNRNRRYRRGGFTLLEVMLVLGILVVLAAFVVPSVIGGGKQAKIDATKAMIGPSGTLGSKISEFQFKVGKFPEKLIDLVERPDYIEEKDDRWYKFLESANFNDAWGNELVYKAPGDVNKDGYDLISKGPDAQEGTEDDIVNYKKE